MFKTLAQLTTEIDDNVTANSNSEITGPILNGVLKNLAGSFGGSFFQFPLAAGVVSGDIGKLMMNDGSGTAKVYQLSPATLEQLGRWVIFFELLTDLSDLSVINIEVESLNYDEGINRETWRDGNTPTTVEEEMELIRDYINDNVSLPFLTATITSGELIIEENTQEGTIIKLKLFPDGSYVDIVSRPALPAAPTSFPLGKLLAIDGDTAIISSNPMETYPLDGTVTINHDVFNYAIEFDMTDMEEFVETFIDIIIVPTSDGKVKSFDPNDFETIDGTFLNSFRHHFIGIAVASTSNSVTVINLSHFSLLFSIFARIYLKLIHNDKD